MITIEKTLESIRLNYFEWNVLHITQCQYIFMMKSNIQENTLHLNLLKFRLESEIEFAVYLLAQ